MLLYLLFLPLVFSLEESDPKYWKGIAEKNLLKKLEEYKRLVGRPLPKNVILFVGNGLGVNTFTLGMIYKAEKAGKTGKYAEMPLFVDTFPSNGIVKTSSLTSHTTSSEAGMMAMLTGRKTDDGKIGTLPGKAPCVEENAIQKENIAELAITLQKKDVGLVTDMELSNPTTATLFAKAIDTSSVSSGTGSCAGKDVTSQLLNSPASQFKVLIGEEMTRDISGEWKGLAGKRSVVVGIDELKKYSPNGEQLMGITAKGGRSPGQLTEMTEKAITAMEKSNEKGYLLVIHSGRIESALHANQARVAAEELLEFEQAVKKARGMTDLEETLILVATDSSHALSLPGHAHKSTSLFDETIVNPPMNDTQIFVKGPKGGFTIGLLFLVGPGGSRSVQYSKKEGADPNFVSPAIYQGSRSNKAADDVGIFADGPFSWLFTGVMDNTEIAYRLKYVMCLDGRSNCDTIQKRQSMANRIMIFHVAGVAAVVLFIVAVLLYALCLQKKMRRRSSSSSDKSTVVK